MAGVGTVEKTGHTELITGLMATLTITQIYDVLRSDHGWTSGRRPIERFCARVRAEQGGLNRAAIQGAIAPTVAHDISVLDRAIDKLALWFDDEGLRVSERLLVVRELRQVIATKLSNAGGDSAERVADAVAAFAVLATRALEGPPEDVGE